MATLTGTAPKNTYTLLLKVDSSGLDTTLRTVEDGDATGSALMLATDNVVFKAGTGSGQASGIGKITVDTTKVGTVGTGEDTLITYDLPANSLSSDGKGVRITAWGTTGANGNGKIVKLHFGGTVIRQIGSSAINDKDWLIPGTIIRTGASTQDAIGTEIVDSVSLNTHSEPGEDTTTATTIKITGEGTSDNDVVCEVLLVEFIG